MNGLPWIEEAAARFWVVVGGLCVLAISAAAMTTIAKGSSARPSIAPGRLPSAVGHMTASTVLNQWGARGLRRATWWYVADIGFAAGYGAALSVVSDSLAAAIPDTAWSWLSSAGEWARWVALTAGLLDIVENVMMLVVIRRYRRSGRVAWLAGLLGYLLSTIKWLALATAVVLLLLAATQLDVGQPQD